MARLWASWRARRTASAEQQLNSPSLSGSDQSSRVTPTASAPRCATSSAATALSTPPLIATSARSPTASSAACSRAIVPSARCKASAASSAAWRLAGLSPPSSRAISPAPMRAASSRGISRTRDTVALPAASSAPQPRPSNPASAIAPSGLPGRSESEIRIRSAQAAPPAAPVQACGGVRPRPCGCSRCSARPRAELLTRPSLGARRARFAPRRGVRRAPARSRRRR